MNPHRPPQPLTSAITVECGADGILSIVRACFDSLAWEQKIRRGWIDFLSVCVLLIKRNLKCYHWAGHIYYPLLLCNVVGLSVRLQTG